MATLFNSLESSVFEATANTVEEAFNKSVNSMKEFMIANPKNKIHSVSFGAIQTQNSESSAAGCVVLLFHSDPCSKGGVAAKNVIVETAVGTSKLNDITEAIAEADATLESTLSTYLNKEFLDHSMHYVAEATSESSTVIGNDFTVLHLFLIKK